MLHEIRCQFNQLEIRHLSVKYFVNIYRHFIQSQYCESCKMILETYRSKYITNFNGLQIALIWILSKLHKTIGFLVSFGFFSRSFYNLHYAIQLNKRSCSIFYKTLSLTQISKKVDYSSQQSISNYFQKLNNAYLALGCINLTMHSA